MSEFQALLDWRNTPSEGMDTNPAQRLMGRRCRTLLPMSEFLLRPSYPLRGDVVALARRKLRKKNDYDRHVKPLKAINLGESVRARLPGEKVWLPAECVGFAGPRRYLVKTGDDVYRRNRRDLLSTGEPPVTDQFDSPVTPQSSRSNAESTGANLPPPDAPESSVPSVPESVPTSVEQGRQETPSPVPFSKPPASLRRSHRERRPPRRFQDFVVN